MSSCSSFNYGSVEYWDDHYSHYFCNPPFEWYQSYDSLKRFLTSQVLSPCNNPAKQLQRPRVKATTSCCPTSSCSSSSLLEDEDKDKEFVPKHECKVLIVGCGSSRLGEKMVQDGWVGGIWNIDYSHVCIEQMKKYQHGKKIGKDLCRGSQEKVKQKKEEEALDKDANTYSSHHAIDQSRDDVTTNHTNPQQRQSKTTSMLLVLENSSRNAGGNPNDDSRSTSSSYIGKATGRGKELL